MTDDVLITRFISGDVAAFNTLVWRWQKPIYNFILRYLGNAEMAKDLTQNTFIKIYKKLPGLRDKSRFTTWMFQIAINTCRDEKRNQKYNKVLIDDMYDTDNENSDHVDRITIKTEDDPSVNVIKKELVSTLNKALQSISEEQRIVIIMKEYHGFKFVEIARALNLPLNTVKSRMYYGLSALRKVLKKWDVKIEDLSYEM